MANKIQLQKTDVLTDQASIDSDGEEHLIGKYQVDEETMQIWGFGNKKEGNVRTEYLGVWKADIQDGSGSLSGDVLLALKKYHAGEGYEVVKAEHTSSLSSEQPLEVPEKAKQLGKVEYPDYLAVYFVPDSGESSSDGSLDRASSTFYASTTRERK